MRFPVLLLLAIRLFGPMVFCSGADALTIAWSDLKNTVANRPVTVEVERVHKLRGSIIEQTEGSIRVLIESTSPRNLHKRNDMVWVERSAITRFHVVKDPTQVGGRISGTLLGLFLGGALGAAAGGGEQNAGGVLGIAFGPMIGYYTGKSLDRQTMEIHLLDTQPSPPPAARPGKSRAGLPGYLQSNPAR